MSCPYCGCPEHTHRKRTFACGTTGNGRGDMYRSETCRTGEIMRDERNAAIADAAAARESEAQAVAARDAALTQSAEDQKFALEYHQRLSAEVQKLREDSLAAVTAALDVVLGPSVSETPFAEPKPANAPTLVTACFLPHVIAESDCVVGEPVKLRGMPRFGSYTYTLVKNSDMVLIKHARQLFRVASTTDGWVVCGLPQGFMLENVKEGKHLYHVGEDGVYYTR